MILTNDTQQAPSLIQNFWKLHTQGQNKKCSPPKKPFHKFIYFKPTIATLIFFTQKFEDEIMYKLYKMYNLSKELDRKVDKWVYQGLLFKIS